ncbi:SMC5-like protein [Podospora fimiseda]|uniref:Structural maintenance of chromosomes protein 5 n=1 Tax=Podospora fimiseda TaxID=252190 RepID=A0AAN7H4R0_9PEZI|nr:SMC5-like protein [Podospora fimiseda]
MGDVNPRRRRRESSDEDSDGEPSRFSQFRSQPPSTRPDRSEFQTGAIVRVKLTNFVTYHEAEFTLGPNLNMIIGPNGTGKSSLVCAICLGLGYPANVLGRASAFGDFVKHGSKEANIEIELQGEPEAGQNHIVGLCISASDNSRRFSMNGQQTTLKEVQKLMRFLRIQIDNLCQFLPQDRVAEFAGISPVDLLEKTLQAAAPREMIDWQVELKQLFKRQEEAQVTTGKTREEVRKMEARQQVLQADVEKLLERKAIMEEIKKWKTLMPMVTYNDARRKFMEAKKAKREAEEDKKRLEARVAPTLQAEKDKVTYRDQIKLVVAHRKQQFQTAEKAADDALRRVDAVKQEVEECESRLKAEQTDFDAKKKERGKILKRITDLKASLNKVPSESGLADLRTKIRDLEHKNREKIEEKTLLLNKLDQDLAEAKAKKNEISEVQNEVKELESKQGQRVHMLKNVNPDVAKGWEWLQKNQDQFEKEVFGPPMLTCSIKDDRYSDVVQGLLGKEDFLCFTTQTVSDQKRLMDQLIGVLGLSVTIRGSMKPLSSFEPPLPREQLAGLGLDGYALDYLDGPEPVLAMLCFTKRLHASGVALRDISDEQFQRIGKSDKITQFAAGNRYSRITRRREYGPDAVSTRTVQFGGGRFWKDQPVEAAAKEELLRKERELGEQYKALKAKLVAQKEQVAAMTVEHGDSAKELEQLTKEKSERQREINNWKGIPTKITVEEGKLSECERKLKESRARKRKLEEDKEKTTLKSAQAVLQHCSTLSSIRAARNAHLEAQIILLEAESDLVTLHAKNSEINQRLKDTAATLTRIKANFQRLREEAMEAQQAAGHIMTDENKEELVSLAENHTVETINQAIDTEQTKLEVIQASNPEALEEYERYATRIATQKAEQEKQESKLAKVNSDIDRIKSEWEPRLDELVGKINDAFSYNFEQINCAGEVSVHKDEDFERWAIEIKVRFRQGETLQRLNSQRQSGGERAVSTIFYLMALQSLAQAPFRVVDEINQGMDPRNERMVHERMVEVACHQHTSQYFLITPKLLPGLRYDERIKVHTIVSGEHVDPKGKEKMNFSKFVKIQRRLKGY